MDYEFLRQMADSWGLLYMFVLFVGVVLYVFRPGSKKFYQDLANIPMREDK